MRVLSLLAMFAITLCVWLTYVDYQLDTEAEQKALEYYCMGKYASETLCNGRM